MSYEVNANQEVNISSPIEGELTEKDLKDICGGAYLLNGVHIPRPRAGVQSGRRVKSAPPSQSEKTAPAHDEPARL